MNQIEIMVLGALEKEHGSIWEPVEEQLILEKLPLCEKLYKSTSKTFGKNPSAYNYNFLITAMITFQYWTLKETHSSSLFTLEADF